jgi:lysozyme family protein
MNLSLMGKLVQESGKVVTDVSEMAQNLYNEVMKGADTNTTASLKKKTNNAWLKEIMDGDSINEDVYDYLMIGMEGKKSSIEDPSRNKKQMQPSPTTLVEVTTLLSLLEGEGFDSRDKGGAHKFGISARYHPESKRADFDLIDAMAVYKQYIRTSKMLDVIAITNDRNLGLLHFSAAFNLGAKRAAILLQRTINTYLPSEAELKVDGLIGKRTLSALSDKNEIRFTDRLAAVQIGFYQGHGAHSQQYFIQGWINRVSKHFQYYLQNGDELKEDMVQRINQSWMDRLVAETSPRDEI